MSFEIVDHGARSTPDVARVRIRDFDVSVVNALRRVILSKVPNVGFAFDSGYHGPDPPIRIHVNDTPLNNEIMQHRMSLVPVRLSLEEIRDWDPERYRFVIDKTNTRADALLPVTSADIQVIDATTDEPLESMRKRLFPPNPITKDYIMLTKLHVNKTARFHAEMRAVVGDGKRNASFGMVSTCAYANVVDEALAEKEREKIRAAAESDAQAERAVRKFDTLDVQRKFQTNRYREPNHFLFNIVSECAVPALAILGTAIDVLATLLERLVDAGDDQGDDMLDVREEAPGLFVLHTTGADHTEGNVIQSILFNHVVRETHPSLPQELRDHKLKYIGYNVPHPLETRMLVKFTGRDIDDVGVARRVIAAGVRHVATVVRRDVEAEWIKTYAMYKK